MSLYKAIEHQKEHRQQYRGAKLYSCKCRNHGSCSWCERSRTFNNIKRLEKSKSMEEQI